MIRLKNSNKVIKNQGAKMSQLWLTQLTRRSRYETMIKKINF